MIVTFQNSPKQEEENLSPRTLSSVIAQRQRNGEDVKCLIAPTPIDLQPDADDASNTAAMQSPTKKPKNHLQANRRALIEKQQRNNRDAAERQEQQRLRASKLEAKKQRLYGKVRSRVYDTASSSSQPSPDDACSVATASHSLSNESYHIAFGRRVGSPAAPLSTCSESVASGARHKSYGQVPKYITQRRERIEREEEARRISEANNAPPAPGLRLMEESERLETLRMLDESEKAAKEELRNIPFSMNHKAARLRDAINYRLSELEDTRKIFSKERVWVSENDE
ncbi:hypothetical protein ACHAXT_004153 [Thalassiosira profunda]